MEDLMLVKLGGGLITIKDASGVEVDWVKPFIGTSQKCCIYATKDYNIASWSIGNEGDTQIHPTNAWLVTYTKDRRRIEHSMNVSQTQSNNQHFFINKKLKQGEILAIEVLTKGDGDTVSGTFELTEDI